MTTLIPWLWHPSLLAVCGGLFIGLASAGLLWGLGRIMGVSGILAQALLPPWDAPLWHPQRLWRMAFLLGLLLTAPWAMHSLHLMADAAATMPYPHTPLRLIVGGLLVGAGTAWASGCTSGHGVCGLGRGSLRSLVAVASFMGSGMITMLLIHALSA